MDLQEHELKVEHVASGKEMVISKSLYAGDPESYKVLKGTKPKIEKEKAFAPPTMPKAKLADPVETKEVVEERKPSTPKKATKTKAQMKPKV